MKRFLIFLGIFAPLLYVFNVILGGLLDPNYSHILHHISALEETGAPNKALFDVLFGIGGPLMIVFTLTAFFYLRGINKTTTTGMLIFIFTQLCSLGFTFFPQDPIGAPMTFAGTMHLVVAGLVAPGTIATVLVTGLGLRKLPGFQRFSLYSLAASGVIFISGLLTVIATAQNIPVAGLLERITIGAYQVWTFWLAVRLLRRA